MMEKVKLADFVDKNGQTETARQLKISQSGLRKALLAKRNIILDIEDGKIFSALEIKPFPSSGSLKSD